MEHDSCYGYNNDNTDHGKLFLLKQVKRGGGENNGNKRKYILVG